MEHGPFSSMIYVDIPIKSGDMFPVRKVFWSVRHYQRVSQKGISTIATDDQGKSSEWQWSLGLRYWTTTVKLEKWMIFFAEKKTSGL